MTEGYRRALAATLAKRWIVVVLWFVVAGVGDALSVGMDVEASFAF